MNALHLVCFYSVKFDTYMATSFLGEMRKGLVLSPVENTQVHIHTPVSLYRHFLKTRTHSAAVEETVRMFSELPTDNRRSEVEAEIFAYLRAEERKVELLRDAARNTVEMVYPHTNKKVQCIKMIRQISGGGLRECKEAYEAAWEEKVKAEGIKEEQKSLRVTGIELVAP